MQILKLDSYLNVIEEHQELEKFLVEVERIGYWAPRKNEPENHFNAKKRLKNLLEPRGFDVYPEYKLKDYDIPDLGVRGYTVDLFCEHKKIESWKFIVEINGEVHYKNHKMVMRTIHRTNEIREREDMVVYTFHKDDIVGKYKMSDPELAEVFGLDVFG
jgi:hypothetical protein